MHQIYGRKSCSHGCNSNVFVSSGPNLGRVSDSKEKKKLKKLRALVSYRKRKGQCALLQRKSKDRRIQVTPDYQGPVKETKLPKCSYKFSEGETCEKPCVPLIKYCMDRILLFLRKIFHCLSKFVVFLCHQGLLFLGKKSFGATQNDLYKTYKPYSIG